MPKDFKYRGKTVEELKAMSMDEFIQLLPSRMRRSLRRGLSNEQRIVLEKLRRDTGGPIRTHARDLVILPEMIGKSVHVFNGKEFIEVRINEKMVGHYLGEYAITMTPVRHGRPGIGASRSSMYIPLK
ncbi:30S ribosomal protein S19 [Candidatus Bathyarchaeota archaeon]|jgi:small subunit ribosomal protein S19|nr:30S ribosomal protein S19 [Candidatus Bathyarchaeota archaeon]